MKTGSIHSPVYLGPFQIYAQLPSVLAIPQLEVLQLIFQYSLFIMLGSLLNGGSVAHDQKPTSGAPSWVEDLRPAGTHGVDLLKRERSKSTIDVERLCRFIYTDKELERQQRLLRDLEQDKAFDKSHNYFEGRVERYKRSLMRAKRLNVLRTQNGWGEEDLIAAIELVSEPTSYTLHWTMFVVRGSFGVNHEAHH